MYTTREFRDKTKEALDKVDKGEVVLITRGSSIYEVRPHDPGPYEYQVSKSVRVSSSNPMNIEGVKPLYGCGCVKTEAKLCKKHRRS